MSYSGGIVKELICIICNKKFEYDLELKTHLLEHSSQIELDKANPLDFLAGYEIENYQEKTYNHNENISTTSLNTDGVKYKQVYKCACGKEFKKKNHLDKHSIIHSGVKPFTCLICNKSFTRKDRLKDHFVIHLANGWSCYFCGKMFAQRCILRKHEMTHRGVKPYSCELCDKRFSRKNDLVRHVTSHTGEKSYLCDLCKKPFSQNRLLRRHQQTHKKDYT